jgi:tetratricopeptide (TPR) repeat protein
MGSSTARSRLLLRRVLSAAAVTLCLLVLLSSGPGRAQAPCAPPAARVVSLQGAVELRRAGTDLWTPAMLEDGLCIGDALRVGEASRAALALANDSILRLDQRTTLQLRGVAEEERSLLELLFGAVYFFSHRPRALEVDTPFVSAAAEGTEFLVRVGDDRAEVVMLDGQVLLQNLHGELRVASGEAALVRGGEAPAPMIVARPRDAVAWALYYPPILAELAGRSARPRPLPFGLQTAIERVADNDYAGALQALETVPEVARDARYYTYLAGVLLNVGRTDEAAAAIERALALDPEAGAALAERAIIHVVQNREPAAVTDARRAVELSPGSSSARIALSYALQATFQLEEAREVLREAVARNPEDALAWARLAELELMFGELGAARDAAEQAVALAPELARTQMVLGFAALTRIDISEAKASFERAIALDSANPLSRLGLGLAKIRRSDLEDGRHEIEIAAALDPNDALIRSYLGKAYFEERRDDLAVEQYAIAQQLDPNDPTPWLYDAIRKQLDNRPVEALHDLERSIALNDNRAIYRSRLLLDEDFATRSASLARLLDELGFEQRAIAEAANALAADPASLSAHRFLADAYQDDPRFEVARASEVLQSQLLQPLILNAFPPSARETELTLPPGTAPADVGLNEFAPLFERDRIGVVASGAVGNDTTIGDEAIVSALAGRFSASAGQFHYETDGFRENNDLNTDIVSVVGQAAVSPEINLQAEFRRRDTEQGDRRLNFDPDLFSRLARENFERDTARAGLRFSPRPSTDVVVSFIHSDVERDRRLGLAGFDEDVDPDTRPTRAIRTGVFDEQVLAVHRGAGFSLIGGGGLAQIETEEDRRDPVDGMETGAHADGRQRNAFILANLTPWRPFVITAGGSYDSVDLGQTGGARIDVERFNPKLGVQWQMTDWLGLRLALIDTVRRTLADELTLEPTQVAGFNQFFDDLDGTRARRLGLGLDLRVTDDLSLDLILTRRDLDVPFIDARFDEPRVLFADFDEQLHRVDLNWTPHPRWAFSVGAEYERVETSDLDFVPLPAPKSVETFEIPVSAAYYDPGGIFMKGRVSFVDQKVELFDTLGLFDEGGEDFFVVGADVGYRLPKRIGIVSLRIENLLNEAFNFQDAFIQESFTTESTLRFEPERRILLQGTINF